MDHRIGCKARPRQGVKLLTGKAVQAYGIFLVIHDSPDSAITKPGNHTAYRIQHRFLSDDLHQRIQRQQHLFFRKISHHGRQHNLTCHIKILGKQICADRVGCPFIHKPLLRFDIHIQFTVIGFHTFKKSCIYYRLLRQIKDFRLIRRRKPGQFQIPGQWKRNSMNLPAENIFTFCIIQIHILMQKVFHHFRLKSRLIYTRRIQEPMQPFKQRPVHFLHSLPVHTHRSDHPS